MIERILDFPRLMRGWIVEKLLDSDTFKAIVDAVGSEIQEVEDALHSIAYGRTLANATGAQLDQWGELVGEERAGKGDDDYRRFIAARIMRNNSNGTPDELILILDAMVEPSSVVCRELYPASLSFEYIGGQESASVTAEIHPALQRAAVAGVLVDPVVKASSNPFRFDSGPGLDQGELASVV